MLHCRSDVHGKRRRCHIASEGWGHRPDYRLSAFSISSGQTFTAAWHQHIRRNSCRFGGFLTPDRPGAFSGVQMSGLDASADRVGGVTNPLFERLTQGAGRAQTPQPWAHAPRRHRTIWISDTHLGTRGCKAELLLNFLIHNECDMLYLVGGIVDGWRLTRSWFWHKSHNALIDEILRKAQGGRASSISRAITTKRSATMRACVWRASSLPATRSIRRPMGGGCSFCTASSAGISTRRRCGRSALSSIATTAIGWSCTALVEDYAGKLQIVTWTQAFPTHQPQTAPLAQAAE